MLPSEPARRALCRSVELEFLVCMFYLQNITTQLSPVMDSVFEEKKNYLSQYEFSSTFPSYLPSTNHMAQNALINRL